MDQFVKLLSPNLAVINQLFTDLGRPDEGSHQSDDLDQPDGDSNQSDDLGRPDGDLSD